MPSEVVLAHQVLRKVKMAPKRGWSEDSQGSPPREPSPPIPPQRKYKIKQPKILDKEESQLHNTEVDSDDKSQSETTGKNQLKQMEGNLHGSSELMLVLLPGSRAATEERDAERRETIESLKTEESDVVAPPMSLSAPELSSYEPLEWGLLRASVSSSELMHEKAMARMFQEASEEEAEELLRKRFGVERKRSFEKRTRIKEDNVFRELTSSMEQLPHKDSTEKSEDVPFEPDEELMRKDISGNSERFIQSDKVFNEFSGTYDEDEEIDSEESSLYDLESDLEEPARKRAYMVEDFLEEEEEETYHPRSMVPKTVTLPQIPLTRRSITPEPLPLPKIPTIRLNDDDMSTTQAEERRNDVQPLKPILKVREAPVDRGQKKNFAKKLIGRVAPSKPKDEVQSRASEASTGSRKKVRIEEPDAPLRYGNEGMVVREGEREILLTGEVARSRRKQGRGGGTGGLAQEEADPARVVISHYSDIVREFGKGKRARAKIYLNYEDLKAAAEKAEEPEEGELTEGKDPTKEDANDNPSEANQLVPFDPINTVSPTPPPSPPKWPKSSGGGFLLDLGLFLIACYLYIFKDARLAIPVLALMVCRQIHEAIKSKMPKIWKKEE